MPYIPSSNPLYKDNPWSPYHYVSKKTGRMRLPPPYFTRGYKFYYKRMRDWYKEIERDNRDYWDEMSRYNKKKLFKRVNPNDPANPIYYSLEEFIKKARKYALRRRNAILAEKQRKLDIIAQNRKQAMLRLIAKRRQAAQERRRKYLLLNPPPRWGK